MIDRCGSGKQATINDPSQRTINRDAEAGSAADWTRFNPWRAPGSAPVYDPCGRASGGPHATPGHGEFTNTTYARIGDMGSRLPKLPSGAVWKAGDVVETVWSLRANHGGGFQWRLCPVEEPLTEACFQARPLPFVGQQSIQYANGTRMRIDSKYASTDDQLRLTGLPTAAFAPPSGGSRFDLLLGAGSAVLLSAASAQIGVDVRYSLAAVGGSHHVRA